jgi:hypothetical protein
MRTRRQVEQAIVQTLRALKRADAERATALRRDLAEATVELREHFVTPEGRPDWTGRSGEYRLVVRDLYSTAGYSLEESRKLQATIRWHIGNIVRERLSEREREDAGLSSASPRERGIQARQQRSELLRQARELLAQQQKSKGRRS